MEVNKSQIIGIVVLQFAAFAPLLLAIALHRSVKQFQSLSPTEILEFNPKFKIPQPLDFKEENNEK